MDEQGRTRKKPSAISARPLARAPSGRGPVTPVTAGPPTQMAAQPAPAKPAETLSGHEAGEAAASPNVKGYIERQLKSVYDDVLNQPIPDRFVELLNALDQATEGGAPKTEGKE